MKRISYKKAMEAINGLPIAADIATFRAIVDVVSMCTKKDCEGLLSYMHSRVVKKADTYSAHGSEPDHVMFSRTLLLATAVDMEMVFRRTFDQRIATAREQALARLG